MTIHKPFEEISRKQFLRFTSMGTAASVLTLLNAGTRAEGTLDLGTVETEANRLVTRFCELWSGLDVDQLMPFIGEELEYHIWEGGPVVRGASDFRARFAESLPKYKEIEWEIFRSFAIGDVVINERLDHFIQGENASMPDAHHHIVGVFLVRDGKIQYWKDYNMPGYG